MCDDLRMVIPCYPITFLSQCHHHCMSLSVPSSSLFLAGREAESARFTAETATDGEVRGSKLYISWPTLRYSIYKCNIPAYVYIYIFCLFIYLIYINKYKINIYMHITILIINMYCTYDSFDGSIEKV